MPGAADTANGPDVAPGGMVMLMEVLLQELIVAGVPFSSTTLPACVAPYPVPDITTGLPIDPVVAETLVITGAGADAELTETLSKVAVARADLLPLFAAQPTQTLCAMLMDWRCANCTQ